jgi:hypothetical protein
MARFGGLCFVRMLEEPASHVNHAGALVPDTFFSTCRTRNSGLCLGGLQNINVCSYLAASAGATNTNEGLTRNLLVKGLRLC